MTYKKAVQILYDNTPMEIIYNSTETSDFFEFRGECAGDMMCYRVYKEDGAIYAK
jgi:hypothetical protein